jgi:hypothetical protein
MAGSITGLVLNSGASGPTAYAGANCLTSGQTVSALSASGGLTCISNRQMFGGGSGGTGIASNTTVYLGSGYQIFTGAAFTGAVMPFSGTLRNLYVISNEAPGAGQAYTFKLGKNNTFTGTLPTRQLTGTGSGAGITTCNDNSNTLSVSAGDYVALQDVTSVTAAASSVIMFGYELDNP